MFLCLQKFHQYTRRKVVPMALEKSTYFPKCALTFTFENFLLHYKHGYAQRRFCNASTHALVAIHLYSLNTRFFRNSPMRRTLLTLISLTVQSSHSTGVKLKPYQQLCRAKWMLKKVWVFSFFLSYISELK